MNADRASGDQAGPPAAAGRRSPDHDRNRSAAPGAAGRDGRGPGTSAEDGLVVRRTPDGWQVDGAGGGRTGGVSPDEPSPGEAEALPDLVSAMVLAELLAGDVPRPRKPGVSETPDPPGDPGSGAVSASGTGAGTGNTPPVDGEPGGEALRGGSGEAAADGDGAAARGGTEASRLKATVAQLEHALATRVRIEQAIGILAERHRLTPRKAFDLLRKVARSSGSRVHDLAGEVVASTSNPLLLLPAELGRPQLQPNGRGRARRERPR